MKNLISGTCAACVFIGVVSTTFTMLEAAQRKALKDVDTDAVRIETQVTIGTEGNLKIVWAIPIEFWEASLLQNSNVTERQRRVVVDALSKYMMIGVLRADVSPLGQFNFYDEEAVFQNIKASYVDSEDKRETLSLERTADGNVQDIIDAMKPMLRRAMGEMGNNFHFFVGRNSVRSRQPLISSYEPGSLKIELAPIGRNKGDTAEISFPLNSLFEPRLCSRCSKEAHISWKFCPWCGTKHKP